MGRSQGSWGSPACSVVGSQVLNSLKGSPAWRSQQLWGSHAGLAVTLYTFLASPGSTCTPGSQDTPPPPPLPDTGTRQEGTGPPGTPPPPHHHSNGRPSSAARGPCPLNQAGPPNPHPTPPPLVFFSAEKNQFKSRTCIKN